MHHRKSKRQEKDQRAKLPLVEIEEALKRKRVIIHMMTIVTRYIQVLLLGETH